MANANPPVTSKTTAASIQVLAANADRTGLSIVNVGLSSVSLTFGHPAIVNGGITLLPGDSFSMDSYLFSTQAVNAISATPSLLSIQEFQ